MKYRVFLINGRFNDIYYNEYMIIKEAIKNKESFAHLDYVDININAIVSIEEI